MKIGLITPAGRGSRSGNRATADRWRRLLQQLGHRVTLATEYREQAYDVLIAIHAWRSASSVRRFAQRYPNRPLIVLLAGTDIYRFQHEDPQPTLASLRAAHALIGLHQCVAADIPDEFRDKLGVVLQSARPLAGRRPALKTCFEVCVIGHLRAEKDSLRAAYAVRDLPPDSRIIVNQLGRAHSAHWAKRADAETATNARYRWWGERAPTTVRRVLARARVMVISSRMEGGANVVSEACVAGLAVIASRIPGNLGLLGKDYPGYFPVADTQALCQLLRKAETDPDWLEVLRGHCQRRARLFTPQLERQALADILARAKARAAGSSASG